MDLSMIFDDLPSVIELMIVTFTPKVFYSMLIVIALLLGLSVVFFITEKRKVLFLIGLNILVGITLVIIFFSPKVYERSYTEAYGHHVANDNEQGLKDLAADKDLIIGFASGIDRVDKGGVKARLMHEFNSYTSENDLKWSALLVDGELRKYDFTEADRSVAFAKEHGMRFRGHALIWGKGKLVQLTEEAAVADDPGAYILEEIRYHIKTVVGRYKGQVDSWDVVNEPMALMAPGFESNVFYDHMGIDYIKEALKAAHEADPDAKLFINGYVGADEEILYDLFVELIEEGIPIHGYGMQGHVMNGPMDIEKMTSFLKRISDLGLEVEITEMDVRLRAMEGYKSDDIYESQGIFYGEVIKACMEIENFRGVTFWGVNDERTWYDSVPPYKWQKPSDPLLFDSNWNRKPSYYHIYDVLMNI